MSAPPLLELRGLCKRYPARRGLLGGGRPAVEAAVDVDLVVEAGQTTALVGESGSGKSTVALCALRLLEPDAGQVLLEGQDLTAMGQAALRPLRPRFQAVFQDPWASLNPRMCVRDLVGEALEVHSLARGDEVDDRVARALDEVGLPRDAMTRRPAAFSGGQRQRIAIARALVLEPRLLVCDEPTSALDVSVQAQVLALLRRLQQQRGLGILFISHDLGVVRQMARRVAIMQAGRVVERGETRAIFEAPQHPTTQALLENTLSPRKKPKHG
jgi:ABC-type microcin C transport system duplicated ATPase subunit YejF